MTEIFSKYAYYYDLIYKDKDYARECDFLEDIFKRYVHYKPEMILDLACGTGGHAILLAKRGYEISGIDMSEDMIKIAKEKTELNGLNIDYYVQDMGEIRIERKFDAAIAMFSAMNYLTEVEDLKRALMSIRSHLKKDGFLIFDFWNGFAVLSSCLPLRLKSSIDGGKEIIRISETILNKLQQRCEVRFDCLILENNILKERIKEVHTLRYYFPEEVRYLLRSSGFEVINMCPFLEMNRDINENDYNVSVIAKADNV